MLRTNSKGFLTKALFGCAVLSVLLAATGELGRANDSSPNRVREVYGTAEAEEPVCSGKVFVICDPTRAQREATKRAKEEARYDAEDRCMNQHGGEVKYTSPGTSSCELYPGEVRCTAKVRVRCEVGKEAPKVSHYSSDHGSASESAVESLAVGSQTGVVK